MSSERVPLSGLPPVSDGPVPNPAMRSDGQHVDHWVLSAEERAKGFIRPVRLRYKHVGHAGPKYPLRLLTPEEQRRYAAYSYAKYEAYPPTPGSAVTGRFWTQAQLDAVGKGCDTVTSMPLPIAETYAVNPHFYGITFCCGCGNYFPVAEFVWDDDNARVGT